MNNFGKQQGGSEMKRVKVTIRCNECGEKYILRGRKEKGKVETGFKRCLCDNDKNFEIYEEEI